jgi:long-chain acyl-CoA synthetase
MSRGGKKMKRQSAATPSTIGELLSYASATFPDNTALVLGEERLTYRELDRQASRTANLLIESGVRQGDHVALLMSYSPAWLVSYFGIVKAGARSVILNSILRPADYPPLLADSDSSVLLTERSFAKALAEHLPSLPKLTCTLEVDSPEYNQRLESAPVTAPEIRLSPDEPTALIYTSGVLGRQKGVIHSHASLLAAAEIVAPGLEQREDDVVVGMIPFFYLLGLAIVAFISVLKGSTIVIVPRFTPRAVLELVDREKATILVGVPAMFNALAQVDDSTLSAYDVSSLRMAITAGAKSSPRLMATLEEKYGLKLCELYGTTEAIASTFSDAHSRRLGTAGRAVQDARLLDENGREVPAGEIGEFVCRSPELMSGYYNAPELTSRVLKDGWFYSGDLMRVDEDGYYEYIEKKSFIIVTSAGTKIPPTEVEETLLACPGVAEAAYVGVEDANGNQTPTLFVVPQEGAELTRADLRRYCVEHLADYKMPRHIEIIEAIPKTGSGKMDRRALRMRGAG